MKKLVRVREVKPLDNYKCHLVFEDDTQKVVDLKPFLHGPIFENILHDKEEFNSIKVIDGTIGWANGADIDPDVLYYDLKPAWMEESVSN